MKKEAIETINNYFHNNLLNNNTIYSKLTSHIDNTLAYWFEPNNIKFKKSLYLILDDQHKNILYFFIIPPNSIDKPHDTFYQRNDKDSSSIKIKQNDKEFIDRVGKLHFSFSSYFQQKINYDKS